MVRRLGVSDDATALFEQAGTVPVQGDRLDRSEVLPVTLRKVLVQKRPPSTAAASASPAAVRQFSQKLLALDRHALGRAPLSNLADIDLLFSRDPHSQLKCLPVIPVVEGGEAIPTGIRWRQGERGKTTQRDRLRLD